MKAGFWSVSAKRVSKRALMALLTSVVEVVNGGDIAVERK